MPLRQGTTVQLVRRHVTKGFEKLNARIDQLNTIEGHDILGMFQDLCQKVIDIAPQGAPKRGPKPKPGLKEQYDQALAALGRIEKQEGE